MRVSIVGTGYVGTVAAACLAFLGHHVVGLEIDQRKLTLLQRGEPPLFEPGLDELLTAQLAAGRLGFTDSPAEAMDASDVVFLCVGTPQGADRRPDMRACFAAAQAIGGSLRHHHVVVTKSTVPVGTGHLLASVIEGSLPASRKETRLFSMVSCPEFLREGNAIQDFLWPHRIIVGGDDQQAIEQVAEVYRPILEQSFEGGDPLARPALVRTSLVNAEMVKYAANAFLATKISFINEVANVCERVDADVTVVSEALGLDPRIGPQFLNAGAGWGGSCFGKDLHGLVELASDVGYEPRLLKATLSVNQYQRWSIIEKLQSHLHALPGRRVALLGLAFKAGTDDLRDAPAIDVAGWLIAAGASVVAHDPLVRQVPGLTGVEMAENPYASAAHADAVVLLTDWPEYRSLDLEALRCVMAGNLLIDARNLLDPDAAVRAGLAYRGIGRGGLTTRGQGTAVIHLEDPPAPDTPGGAGTGSVQGAILAEPKPEAQVVPRPNP